MYRKTLLSLSIVLITACSSSNTADINNSQQSSENLNVANDVSINNQTLEQKTSHSELSTTSVSTVSISNTEGKSISELKKLYPKDQFKYFYLDVNDDDIDDLIITETVETDLYVYLGSKNNKYILDLEYQNFTADGGMSLGSIMPRNNNKGFIISNYLTDSYGNDYFYLTYNQGKWTVTKYTTDSHLITGESFYCIEKHNHNAKSLDDSFGMQIYNIPDNKKVEECPMPAEKYEVIVNKAEILDESFQSRNPPNYFIKSDIVIAEHQNEDWIRVRYKNNSKVGLISKAELKAIH